MFEIYTIVLFTETNEAPCGILELIIGSSKY